MRDFWRRILRPAIPFVVLFLLSASTLPFTATVPALQTSTADTVKAEDAVPFTFPKGKDIKGASEIDRRDPAVYLNMKLTQLFFSQFRELPFTAQYPQDFKIYLVPDSAESRALVDNCLCNGWTHYGNKEVVIIQTPGVIWYAVLSHEAVHLLQWTMGGYDEALYAEWEAEVISRGVMQFLMYAAGDINKYMEGN